MEQIENPALFFYYPKNTDNVATFEANLSLSFLLASSSSQVVEDGVIEGSGEGGAILSLASVQWPFFLLFYGSKKKKRMI